MNHVFVVLEDDSRGHRIIIGVLPTGHQMVESVTMQAGSST